MSMKVSMHNWMRPEPIQATIERLARLGYDGLEISGEPQGFDAGQVRSLLDENGLECWGAVTLMTGGRDLLHEDPYVRLGSVQYVKDCLSFVAALGGKIVTVVPSTVGKIVPMAPPEDEWRWAVEGLQECQAHAEQVGVRIGLEPLNRFETYFLNRCEQALALADAVGGNCGVALDTFHMNIEETDLLEAIRAVTGSSTSTSPTTTACRRARRAGLGRDRRELQGIGYEGHLTVEFVPALDRAAKSATPRRPAAAPASRSSCATTPRGGPGGAVRALHGGLDRTRARGTGRRGLMPAVALIGTLDTKGDEIAYVRERLQALRVDVVVIDSGILGEPGCAPDFTHEEVAAAGDHTLAEIRGAGSRGAAVALMQDGVRALVVRLFAEGRVHGVLCLGGAEGALLGAAAMQALPVGVPKLLVSPSASGRRTFAAFVGESDVCVMHSVVDILGLNGISRPIFDNAAAAMAGMVDDAGWRSDARRALVGVTMLGQTTPGVMRLRESLVRAGHEPVIFTPTASAAGDGAPVRKRARCRASSTTRCPSSPTR